MTRIMEISGDVDKTIVKVTIDAKETKFGLDHDIAAEEIYKALDYKRGDVYEVRMGSNGSIDEIAFLAFYNLLNDIAQKINGYAEEIQDLDVETDSEESE